MEAVRKIELSEMNSIFFEVSKALNETGYSYVLAMMDEPNGDAMETYGGTEADARELVRGFLSNPDLFDKDNPCPECSEEPLKVV